LKSQSAAILEPGFGESLLANSSRRAIVLACSSSESFARRICSARAARSSGRIRSTSAFVVAARISLQSRWRRTSVSAGTRVMYRTMVEHFYTVKSRFLIGVPIIVVPIKDGLKFQKCRPRTAVETLREAQRRSLVITL